MQPWENLFVAAVYERGDWRPMSVNGRPLRDWARGPTLWDFSNQLSAEGWELVTAVHADNCLRLIFKRPRPSPTAAEGPDESTIIASRPRGLSPDRRG